MRRKFLYIAICGILISAALGWWRAAIATQPGKIRQDNWQTVQTTPPDPTAIAKAASQIRATKLFLMTRATERAAAETAPEISSAQKIPAFPSIAAISKVNNIAYAHVITPDGSFVKVKKDDRLENGWVIKTVDLRQVIAVFDGEETRFPVAAYLDTAFDAPENASETASENANPGGEN